MIFLNNFASSQSCWIGKHVCLTSCCETIDWLCKTGYSIPSTAPSPLQVLASSLREDGFADQGEWSPLDTGPSRADSFEYVMHGKIYRYWGMNLVAKYFIFALPQLFVSLAELRVMKLVREQDVSQHMSRMVACSWDSRWWNAHLTRIACNFKGNFS